MATLGDLMAKVPLLSIDSEVSDEIDKIAAASRLYNPGFQADADERDLYLNPGTGQDLKAPNRETLGLYAAQNQAVVNKYHSNEQLVNESTGYYRGDVLSEVTDETAYASSDSVLARQSAAKAYFDTTSGGVPANATLGSFFGANKLQGIITKIGPISPESQTDIGPFDGNDVLRVEHTPEGVLVDTNLTDAIEEVLNSTNRFSPTEGQSPYIKDKTALKEIEAYSRGLWSVQTGKGDRSKTIQTNFGKYDPDAPHVTVKDLRVMALQTIINASGHSGLQDADMTSFGSIADLAALIPSVTQIGVGTVNTRLLRVVGVDKIAAINEDNLKKYGTLGNSSAADDILLVIEDDGIFGYTSDGGSIKGLSTPFSGDSYGGMNSFVEHFDGPMPMGMLLMVLYGVLAFALIGGLMEMSMDTATSTGEDPLNIVDPDSPKEMAMGSSVRKAIRYQNFL